MVIHLEEHKGGFGTPILSVQNWDLTNTVHQERKVFRKVLWHIDLLKYKNSEEGWYYEIWKSDHLSMVDIVDNLRISMFKGGILEIEFSGGNSKLRRDMKTYSLSLNRCQFTFDTATAFMTKLMIFYWAPSSIQETRIRKL